MKISAIDYSVHGRFVESTPERLAEVKELIDFGVPTYKCFMTYGRDGIMCDDDTLLVNVRQTGVACHTGAYSCFFKEIYNDEENEA